jgi:uncharacterized iron-regulated membrane protein
MSKRLLFEIHGWIGINLSIFFFIVCFTGTAATLSHEMDWLFNPSTRATPSEVLASRNQIAANISEAYPQGKILFWPAATEVYSCQIVHVEIAGQRHYVFVNPYTGQVQGESNITFQRFFRDFHYFLFMPFAQFGYFLVLIFSFMLLIATATALFFYKKWWTKLFELKIQSSPLVFFRSLHRLAGVWSVPFTILFSITGIWYFLERTNTAGIHETANRRGPVVQDMQLDSVELYQLSYRIDYDRAESAAKLAIKNLDVKDIVPPSGNDDVLYLTGISDEPLVRARANQVYLHPLTYEVIELQRAEELNTTTWLNDIADPLHFGNWGGLITKIIWFIAGMAISGLVLTGIWIALKRRVKSQKRVQPFWKYLNWAIVTVMVVSMYVVLTKKYSVTLSTYAIISVSLLIFLFLGWYIFDYRLNKQKPH